MKSSHYFLKLVEELPTLRANDVPLKCYDRLTSVHPGTTALKTTALCTGSLGALNAVHGIAREAYSVFCIVAPFSNTRFAQSDPQGSNRGSRQIHRLDQQGFSKLTAR